jgi:hypothetical protein
MLPFRILVKFNLPLDKHRDVYVELSTAILKLKGIGVLCSNLRDVCPAVHTNT